MYMLVEVTPHLNSASIINIGRTLTFYQNTLAEKSFSMRSKLVDPFKWMCYYLLEPFHKFLTCHSLLKFS